MVGEPRGRRAGFAERDDDVAKRRGIKRLEQRDERALRAAGVERVDEVYDGRRGPGGQDTDPMLHKDRSAVVMSIASASTPDAANRLAGRALGSSAASASGDAAQQKS